MDKHYSAGIDFLWAFAVGVILYHFASIFTFQGNQGVTIFFVISGYLMARMRFMRIKKISSPGLKLYKRIKRIYPFCFYSPYLSLF